MLVSTRTLILRATAALIAAGGAEAVTMRRVGAAVGVTPMAIYRHFDGRDALLRAVADDLGTQLRERWSEPAQSGFEDRVRAQLERFLDFALGHPGLYRFLMIDGWSGAARHRSGDTAPQPPAFERFVAMVAELVEEGLLKPDDPEELALSITAQTQGLVQLYLSGRLAGTEAEFRALCERAMWRMIRGVGADR